jgi:hypothetical protein
MSATASTHTSSSRSSQRLVAVIVRALGYLIYAYLLLTLVVLALGFFLLLLGANPSSGFVEWVYRSLERVMAPFRGMFTPIDLGTNGQDVPSILDPSILFAMVVYGIVAMVLHAGLTWLGDRIASIDAERAEQQRRAELELAALAHQAAIAEAQADAARATAAAAVAASATQPSPVSQPAQPQRVTPPVATAPTPAPPPPPG